MDERQAGTRGQAASGLGGPAAGRAQRRDAACIADLPGAAGNGGAAHDGPALAEHWFAHRFDWVRIPEANPRPGGIAHAIEVSAPWRQLPDVWHAARDAVAPLCTRVESHMSRVDHVGGSVSTIFIAQAEDDAGAITLYDRILNRLFSASLQAGGNVSHHHGIGTAKAPWFRAQLGPGYAVLEAVKLALDPESTLSTGVLGLAVRAAGSAFRP